MPLLEFSGVHACNTNPRRVGCAPQSCANAIGGWLVLLDGLNNPNTGRWSVSDEEKQFVKGLMQSVTEPGKVAAWIAPPNKGINNQPFEYEYVKL